MSEITYKHTKLIRDLQNELHELYGANAPVFTEIELLQGHWQVWLLGSGWVRTTDLLKTINEYNNPQLHESCAYQLAHQQDNS